MKKFIFGMFTVVCLVPIVQSITDIICGFLEIPKAITTKKVLKYNQEIQDLQEQLAPQSSSAIGFEIPNCEEYYDEDDE